MTNVCIQLNRSARGKTYNAELPLARSVPKAGQYITNPTTSQQSTIDTAKAGEDIWVITATGGDAWVKFGANPTSSAGNDHLVPAGATREWAVTEDDEICAVING
jgi:hypothetical protein